MKYVDEYRDPDAVRRLIERISAVVRGPWTLMEVCGGQTHGIVRHGIDRMLPGGLELLHGPGCPVCVTPLEMIDRAHAIATRPGIIFCSFGDMLRVPGSNGNLLTARARGADVRVVYSPLQAVDLAKREPEREVVFFGIGFETTAPANAMAVHVARRQNVPNFSMLVSQVLVPPAMTSILQTPGQRVQAFLGPGHVCTVMGVREYEAITTSFRVPIVITGFEPVDLLAGILAAVHQLEAGEARVENAYTRVVNSKGNSDARALMDEVYEVTDRAWRGIGIIPKSGLRLRYEYRAFDAEHRYDVGALQVSEPRGCISGEILRGLKKPPDCANFGTRCTPETPLGATMVSSEGACAAYHQYRRLGVAS